MNETQLIVEFWHLAVIAAPVVAVYLAYAVWRSSRRKEEAARQERWNDAADALKRLTARFDIDEYVKHKTTVDLHLQHYPEFKKWVVADLKALNKHKARAEARENGGARPRRED